MSDLTLALFHEAKEVEVTAEPPPVHGKEVRSVDKVIGEVPLALRRLYVLAERKSVEQEALLDRIKMHQDHDGSLSRRAFELDLEIQLLENNADLTLGHEHVVEIDGEGSLCVRAGWKVVWSAKPNGKRRQKEKEARVLN